MLFKLSLIILSFVFAGALEIIVIKEELFREVFGFLVIFSILVIWPLAGKVRFLAIPFFLSIGSLLLLYLIDEPIEKHVFIGLSAITYYLSILGAYRLKLYDCDQTAQGMINLATLATCFFWFVSTYGWYLNIQSIPIFGWNLEIDAGVLILVFTISSFLIGLPSFMICDNAYCKIKKGEGERSDNQGLVFGNKKSVFFLNFVVALVMGEIIWGLSLWPFGYLTTGVIAVIIYFLIWDVTRLFIQNSLTKGIIITNVTLVSLFIFGILFTAQWELLS